MICPIGAWHLFIRVHCVLVLSPCHPLARMIAVITYVFFVKWMDSYPVWFSSEKRELSYSMVKIVSLDDAFSEIFELEASSVEGQ